ncbi:Translation initiation factor 6 (eIF-6) [Pseudoloma neurophilia]|uniref:Eukaryotic translation initiation factor 6 n=1 Tax=Pseudoloma neurophilia TaxID=146866 RepID=A0A0R0LTC2_9MICR|nr:Translation initiation factor 6 (eIF-6) [Pseudoloma neurophilia]
MSTQRISFERSSEIGAYALLTNKYCLLGKCKSRNFYSHFQAVLNLPMAETTINTISIVGNLCRGNSHGLLLPSTVTDQEKQHVANLLPDGVKIRVIDERLNALGNTVICNDRIALVHSDMETANMEIIENALNVEVIKHFIGKEPLVGAFASMNGQGMLVHPLCTVEEIDELSQLLSLQVMAGTVNKGTSVIGGGIVVNDWSLFIGSNSTTTEMSVAERVFMIGDKKDDDMLKKTWVEGIVD